LRVAIVVVACIVTAWAPFVVFSSALPRFGQGAVIGVEGMTSYSISVSIEEFLIVDYNLSAFT